MNTIRWSRAKRGSKLHAWEALMDGNVQIFRSTCDATLRYANEFSGSTSVCRRCEKILKTREVGDK